MTQYVGEVALAVCIAFDGKGVRPEWALGYSALNHGMAIGLRVITIKGREVGEARQWLAEQAIAQGAEFIFFLDQDVSAPSFITRQLIYRMRCDEDLAIVGGVYVWKNVPFPVMCFKTNTLGPIYDWKVGEYRDDLTGIGMGATLIRTSVLKQLPKPWFATVDDASQLLDGINQITQFTEDLHLCTLLKNVKNPETGNQWKIAGDFSILCEHWNIDGQCFYPLDDPRTRLQIAVPKGKKKILDIGAGENPYKTDEGVVVTADFRPEAKPDYVCDARLLPFANEEFDKVYNSHTLEHFHRNETMDLLKEWTRVIKKDGEMHLVVPDVTWAAKEIVEDKLLGDDDTQGNTSHVLNVLYGAQSFRGNYHYNGFTPNRLKWFLQQVGFKYFDIKTDGYNIICRAKRVPFEVKKKLTTQKLLVAKKAAKPTKKKGKNVKKV